MRSACEPVSLNVHEKQLARLAEGPCVAHVLISIGWDKEERRGEDKGQGGERRAEITDV